MRPHLLAAAAGLLLGIAIGYALFSWGAPDPAPSGTQGAPNPAAEVAAELARLRVEHEELAAENRQLAAENEELRLERERLAVSQPQLASAQATPGRRTGEPGQAGAEDREVGAAPVVTFGTWGDEPALRRADWADMGLRAQDLVRARGSGIGGGQSSELAALSRRAERELGGHLDRIAGEQPELGGHPVVVVNLMASHLRREEKPFQPWQVEMIEAMGREYEAQAQKLREDLSRGDALATEKKLRSILLRKAVVDRIVGDVLTPEQWDLLFDTETKGLLYYDVYQVGGLELERPNSSVYWRYVRADAKEHLQLFLITEWEIPREDVARLDGLVEQWIDAIQALPRPPGHPSSALHMDEVLPCAEVHIQFQKKIMAALGDGELVERIRDNALFAVFPRLRGRN